MEKNVGGTDRLVRLIAGPVLVVVAVASLAGLVPIAGGPGGLALGLVVLVVGAVFVVTGATRSCPANRRLRVNTYRRTARDAGEHPPTGRAQ